MYLTQLTQLTQPQTFVTVDGKNIPVRVKALCMYRDVLVAKVCAIHGKPFSEDNRPTRQANFELSLVKVRVVPITGYPQNDPTLNPA